MYFISCALSWPIGAGMFYDYIETKETHIPISSMSKYMLKKTKQHLIVDNISTTKNSISFNVIEEAFCKFSTLILVITINLHIRLRKLVRKENLLERLQEIRAKARLDMVN